MLGSEGNAGSRPAGAAGGGVGGAGKRRPRSLHGGGAKLKHKWEPLGQTSWEEGRTCVKAGSVGDPGAFAELLRILCG